MALLRQCIEELRVLENVRKDQMPGQARPVLAEIQYTPTGLRKQKAVACDNATETLRSDLSLTVFYDK